MAVINGHFDIAQTLIDKGANVNAASHNGATPLYGVLNVEWAPKALYPQPRAHMQQKLGYLDLMKQLLDKGADPNARLKMKVWYSGYSFDLSGVDEIGATRVLARRLRQRRGGDAPAGRRRRRSEHADDEAGRPARASATCSSSARSGPLGPAGSADRRSVGDCRCRRPPASATARASPPTRTASRRPA